MSRPYRHRVVLLGVFTRGDAETLLETVYIPLAPWPSEISSQNQATDFRCVIVSSFWYVFVLR